MQIVEWNKIKLIKKYIQKIPNYQKYFLLSFRKVSTSKIR